jgi:hypothetical protein
MGKPAEIKTKETSSSVGDFINAIGDEQQRKDSRAIVELFEKVTNEKPKMWGSSMIGFGKKRYKSPATGREVDWFKVGFSPRKANLSLHLVIDMQQQADTLKKLGKHKIGGGCLYINTLADVDIKVLEQLVKTALKDK